MKRLLLWVLCLGWAGGTLHALTIDPPNLTGKLFIAVTDFGAKGDGRTDDTFAVQQAINYCGQNHRALYIPSGHYLISKTLTIGFYPGLQMHGEGWENSEIVSQADGQPILRAGEKDTHSVVIENLKFSYARPQSGANHKSAYAIQFANSAANGSGVYHWIISRVWINNAAVGIGEDQESGISFPVWGCRFEELMFSHIYRSAIILRQPGGVGAGQPLNSFDNIKVFNKGASNVGPVLDLIGEWRITNLDVEDCTGTIISSDSSFANYLSSVHIERHRLESGDTRLFALYDGDYHIGSVAFHGINRPGHPFCFVHAGSENSSISLDGLSFGGADLNSYSDVKFVCGTPRNSGVRNVRITSHENSLPPKLGAAIRNAESAK
jgi:hypothetical protein